MGPSPAHGHDSPSCPHTGFRGRAAGQGRHHDLLRRPGFYYQPYNSQFTGARAEAG